MPGTITFRPVEANITHDTNWLGKMDPYCKFSMGTQHVQSSVCRHGGTRPHWGDTVNLQTTGVTGITGAPNVVRVELFDKDKFRPDDHIAYTDIDLNELEQLGSLSKWYPLYHRKKPAGEILIEAAIQQPVFVQTVVPVTTTYVQETITNTLPVDGIVGESYVVSERVVQTGVPLTQNVEVIGSTNLGSYTTVNPGLIGTNVVTTNPELFSKTSALGPSGGFSHGYHAHKGQTNAGYSERPGYTLGDTEANPTCQSNLDSNGGGFFNKPGREKRVEPYSLSNPGTYGIPHGQTIDTAGHLRPDVTLQRQAPIGTVNHPGVTGYVDGYNVHPQQLQSQQGVYNTGLNTGTGTQSYTSGVNTGLSQPGYGSYTTGLQQGQGSYGTLGQQDLNLVQGNLINSLGQLGLGQQGLTQQGLGQTNLSSQGLNQGYGQLGQQGLTQQGLSQGYGQLGQQGLTQQGLNQGYGQLGQQGLTQQGLGQANLSQGLAQQGVIDKHGPTSFNTGVQGGANIH